MPWLIVTELHSKLMALRPGVTIQPTSIDLKLLYLPPECWIPDVLHLNAWVSCFVCGVFLGYGYWDHTNFPHHPWSWMGCFKHVKASGSFDSTCRTQISCLNVPFPGAGWFKKIKAAGFNCRSTVFGNVSSSLWGRCPLHHFSAASPLRCLLPSECNLETVERGLQQREIILERKKNLNRSPLWYP